MFPSNRNLIAMDIPLAGPGVIVIVVDISQISRVILHQLHNYIQYLIHHLSPKQHTLLNER